PIEFRDFATRQTVGRLGASDVVGIFLVDHFRPGVPRGTDEAERTGPDRLGNGFERVGRGVLLAHNDCVESAERHSDETERLLQADDEGLVVYGFDRFDKLGEGLAESIADHPALDRGDYVASGE